jgi:bifunctional non-homologous end joining protein LigD
VSARREVEVEIDGRRLRLSNLDKVFYPATGFTKREVIDYYVRIAPALLPHLADRPLTLKRYPDGVAGPFFYEKRCPSHRPPWIRTEAVWSEGNQDVIHFCVVDGVASLAWVANLASLELHTYLHRAPRVDRPTFMVFDLDPGPPADAVQCCEVALRVRDLLDELGLRCFPKTSGSKGVQVYVPLDGAVGYDRTKAFARGVAERLEAERGDLVVSSMKKALRTGKVLVDWSQNDVHKTTVCAWSLRARDRPTVSTPLRWREVEAALRARDAGMLIFDAAAAVERFERDGDLFAPVLSLRQALPPAGALGTTAERRRGATRNEPSGAAPPPGPGAYDRGPTRRPSKRGTSGGAPQRPRSEGRGDRRSGAPTRRRRPAGADAAAPEPEAWPDEASASPPRRPAARAPRGVRGSAARPHGARRGAVEDGYLSSE